MIGLLNCPITNCPITTWQSELVENKSFLNQSRNRGNWDCYDEAGNVVDNSDLLELNNDIRPDENLTQL